MRAMTRLAKFHEEYIAHFLLHLLVDFLSVRQKLELFFFLSVFLKSGLFLAEASFPPVYALSLLQIPRICT
jgi:hypothetical protein